MRPAGRIHNLPRNEGNWSPPSWVFFDTETREIPDTEPRVLTLRCWAARLLDRRPPRSGVPLDTMVSGGSAVELAAVLDHWSVGRPTLWIGAHNLSFDLTVTRLPILLADLGWKLNDAAVDGRSPWLRMGKSGRTLTFVDTWSYLPVSVEQLSHTVGIRKPSLPTDGDDLETWLIRCRADAEILSVAMDQLLGWWDRENLGRWSISGARTGWNAMRHIPPAGAPVVVDPDPERQNDDRKAHYGGRRSVWRVGSIEGGPFAEIDFAAAYPTVAANLPLPTKRSVGFDHLGLDDRRLTSDQWQAAADVTITTDRADWPVRIGGRVWYPVGTFRTHLAGPDLAAAVAHGVASDIGPGTVHRLGWASLPWARWVLDCLGGHNPSVPPAGQIAAKSWSRSVIGKWSAHGYGSIDLGPCEPDAWSYLPGWDADRHCRGGEVRMAGRSWWWHAGLPGEQSYPALTAWVESHVRVRLAALIAALGPGCVVQANTDGVIVDVSRVALQSAGGTIVAPPRTRAAGRLAYALTEATELCAPLVPRVKRQWERLQVIGPSHWLTESAAKLSGIPVGHEAAAGGGPLTYRTWPTLGWQMQHGNRGGFARPEITATLGSVLAPGWVLEDGRVVPVEAGIVDGQSVILPWEQTRYATAGDRLADTQNPDLRNYLPA